MPALRLQHTSVQVPADDLARVTGFYVGVLGVRHIVNLAGSAWFELPNGDHIHLVEGPGAPGSVGHLALHVDDYPQTRERVTAFGSTIEEAPSLWGSERCFFRDPVGNLIEIFASPPPSPMEAV
jgi:catechol 2,3-dioxygenase-like lactoylglutathione lyase family enzyme